MRGPYTERLYMTAKSTEPSKGGLTAKQQAFKDEYLIDLNGTQAAIRAGYSEKTACEQAARLLANVKVATAIQKAMAARSERAGITQDEVIEDLKELRDICMGRKKVNITIVSRVEGVAVPMECEQLIIDPAGAKGSLDLLGKHLGMFKDKIELTGKNGGAIETSNSGLDISKLSSAALKEIIEASKGEANQG